MDRSVLWKWLVLAIATVFSIVIVTPPAEKITLGLDLKGGTSFTVQVDREKLAEKLSLEQPNASAESIKRQVDNILKDADSRTLQVLRNRIDALGLNEPVITAGKDHRIQIQLPGVDEAKRQEAERSIKSAAYLSFRLVHKNNAKLVSDLFAKGLAPEGYEIADGNAYRRTKDYPTVSQAPGYDIRLARFQTPSVAYSLLLERKQLKSGEEVYEPCYVSNREQLSGGALKHAEVQRDPMNGQVQVTLQFNSDGARQFAKVTSEYCLNGTKNAGAPSGRQLAIILDDRLYSAPVLNEPIPNGNAVISGSFSWAEGVELRNTLNAGALPAPIKIIETRSVSPTLGQDSINSGIRASVIGLTLVMAFMLMYYVYCGVIADVALLLNIVLWPLGIVIAAGVFSIFARDAAASGSMVKLPTLTLPGIAGFILSIGMAVDANVLIFERIREEFRLGKSARASINAGYDRAFLAIFDSNITTLLTAAILFALGSGPVRGYAVTLAGGIIVSMFTALVVTRLVFNLFTPEARTKPYRMMQWFKFEKVDFVKFGKPAIISSAVIILASCALFAVRAVRNPASVMAVDFTGGVAINYTFEQKPDMEQVRTAALSTGVTDVTPQFMKDAATEILQIKTSTLSVADQSASAAILKALNEKIPNSKFALQSEDAVGSQVGDDLKRDVCWSVGLAFVMIVAYISIRFQFGFGLGAIAALIHDVFITFGLYTLTGSQVSLTVVAALLTIIGYSVNDTIVIFDRIRETLKSNPSGSFKEICNQAVNVTMGRTVLTTLSTLLAVSSLLIFGGGAIRDFALTLFIGMIAGTYSTIFIATPVMLWWYKGKTPVLAAKQKQL